MTHDNYSFVFLRCNLQIPRDLYQKEGYRHREALFGKPAYGSSIAQNVYYADQDFCDRSTIDSTKGYPVRTDGDGNKLPWPTPFILMIDRGECTFVQKVRNAQSAGAAAVLIADSKCLCTDKNCSPKVTGEVCEKTEPIMADDSSGGDVTIPSMLMYRMDAEKIKDVLKDNKQVQVEMMWKLPKPDDRVEYDLYTTPANEVALEFVQKWGVVAQALGKRAYFTPHMYIYDGERSKCHDNTGIDFCQGLCTNNGRYCATDPDNDLDGGISGSQVIVESLRRLCIWKLHGEDDGIGTKFWDYHREFITRCSPKNCKGESCFGDPKCVKDALKHSKIKEKDVNQCMETSGGTDGDTENTRFKNEMDSQRERGVVVIPTAFVNTAAIRGSLTISNVFNAICSGYLETTEPDVCGKCKSCPDVALCVRKGVCSGGSSSGSAGTVSTGFFTFSLVFVVAIFGGAAIWHYKRTRDDMREQVRGILAEYMPLEDNEGGMMNGGSPLDFAHGGGQRTSLIS